MIDPGLGIAEAVDDDDVGLRLPDRPADAALAVDHAEHAHPGRVAEREPDRVDDEGVVADDEQARHEFPFEMERSVHVMGAPSRAPSARRR
jgi:hypothetical protein